MFPTIGIQVRQKVMQKDACNCSTSRSVLDSTYGLVWFEGDSQGCARVNSALDWYHGNVRLPAIRMTWYVMAQTMQHIDKTKHVNEQTAHGQLAVLNSTLKVMYSSTTLQLANAIWHHHCFPEVSHHYVRSRLVLHTVHFLVATSHAVDTLYGTCCPDWHI